MRLALLTSLVLIAFAANSILNRLAVGQGAIDPTSFAALRAASGAFVLIVLMCWKLDYRPSITPRRLLGGLSLSLYLLGFSFSYIRLDAGFGALLLFGGVQVTMFAGALFEGERPDLRRWSGALLGLAGLVWLVWPDRSTSFDLAPIGAMLLAALGWGLFSLLGRGAEQPVIETGVSFVLTLPLMALALMAQPHLHEVASFDRQAVVLAIISGAITSGLGYALWYALLPKLGASRAAILQLTVPVLALIGGVVLLSEPVTWRLVGAGALTLGGVAYGLGVGQRRIGSSGS